MRGRDLRSLREQAGLFRHQLAERVGSKPDYLRNIENGCDQPSAVVANRLARELTIELGRLITLDDFSYEDESQTTADAA